jgi:hypothetical protein
MHTPRIIITTNNYISRAGLSDWNELIFVLFLRPCLL